MDWLTRAACRGLPVNWWYPPKPITPEATQLLKRARAICATCQVQTECLTAGMTEDHGIWAGTSPKQRKRLTKGPQ